MSADSICIAFLCDPASIALFSCIFWLILNIILQLLFIIDMIDLAYNTI